LRDSGLIVLILKEVFNQLYDREDADDITLKLSFIKFDPYKRVNIKIKKRKMMMRFILN
jgi:predicted sulfurtransferase